MWKWGRSVVSDSWWPHGLQPTRLLRPWDFSDKSTGVECHCLLLLMHHRFSLFQNTCPESLNFKIPVLKVVVHDKMQIHKGWWLCHRCIISPHPTSSELSIYSLEIKLDFYQKIVIHFSWLPLFFPYFPFLFSGEKSLIYDYFNIIGKTWGKSLNNWRRWRHTFFPPFMTTECDTCFSNAQGKSVWTLEQLVWHQVIALSSTSWVTLGKLFNFSVLPVS